MWCHLCGVVAVSYAARQITWSAQGRAAERLFVPGCFVSLKGLGCSIYSTLCDVAPGLSCLPFTRCQVLSWRRQLQGQSRSQPLSCGQAFCECGRGHHAQLTHGQPSLLQGPGHPDRVCLPPVSICAHLQMHRSLSASLVLKSLPGWLMLLILPADPVRPFRWILGAQRGEEGDERVCADVKHFPQSSRLPEAPARTCPHQPGPSILARDKQEPAYHRVLRGARVLVKPLWISLAQASAGLGALPLTFLPL